MGRQFVMGDIHGAYRALKQCLERSAFDYAVDELIFLGDVCDGWPDTKPCIDELLRIEHLTFILGNHDWWMLKWMKTGWVGEMWYDQGGKATITSYGNEPVPEEHVALIESANHFVIRERGTLFVHAGIRENVDIKYQNTDTFLWDRSLVMHALEHYDNPEKRLTPFETIYVGHTPIKGNKPMKACEVWLMDTGAGWSGVLSMMDLRNGEIFTSDPVPSLYPGITGRTKK